MARKKNSEVSVETVVSQNEIGSETVITESVTEVTVTEISQENTTAKEEKEEISEDEKVNQEIQEVSEEAEEEAESITDEVIKTDNDEKAVEEELKENKAKNEKFFSFDKKEARRFYVDRDRFLSVIFYKRLLIGIKADQADRIDSLVDYAAIVYNSVEALIKSLRFDDIEYQAYFIDEFKNRDGRDIGIMSIDVPFTEKTLLFINRVRKLIDELSEFCYVRSSSNCRTVIDTTKINSNETFLKGFATFASYSTKKEGVLRITARSGAFIQKALGFGDKDISDLNRYILSTTKLNSVNENGVSHKMRDGTENIDKIMNYYQTMRSRICGMIYDIVDVDSEKGYLVKRTQFYIKICTRKIVNAIVPARIKIVQSQLEQPEWIKNLEEVFTWKDPVNKAGFLGDDNIIGTDPNVINLLDDAAQIQANILENLEGSDIEDSQK